jgi:hypothetical protein
MQPIAGDHEIRLRAYELWQERGEPWGTPEVDWFTAERELKPTNTLSLLAREVGKAIGNAVHAINS